MKSKKTARPAPRVRRRPTLDTTMSEAEKESLIEQIEEFEGPDRREKRGTEKPQSHEPGIARS